ncbi:MAG: S8/S53 family peptidase [Marmoricola sp.]|nr:S8/S53 family peptidase [Marmoricola sp.]
MTVVGALVAAGAAAAPASAATPKRRLAHTQNTWVQHSKAQGNASAKGTSTFRVYLAPRGGLDALKADVAKVSTPGTSSYRHFLSAQQYHAQYDPTAASAASVTQWLRSNDLKVTGTAAHRRYLSVTGTNAAVNKAFSTTIKKYQHDGRSVQANSTPVAVPSSIAPLISTVSGLDTTPRKVTHNAAPSPGFRNARPCSRFYGQMAATNQADGRTPLPKFKGKTLPYAVCGYTGPQYRAAYEGNSALNGSGVTVAITDAYASPTIVKDSNTYATNHGDGAYRTGQLIQSVAGKFTKQKDCNPSGWYGEETLDVEAVHAMAPGARIVYYGAASCYDNDLLDTLTNVVDDNLASLVTNSWGDVEENSTADSVAAYEQVFLQGAMQGQGFLFSSGDAGDDLASTGIKQTDYPTSDPYVTSVGGTSDAIGQAGTFLFQTGWGTNKYSLSSDGTSWTPLGFTSGAGGGQSGLFNRPSYQDGVVSSAYRSIPDVGLDADPTTGMLIGQTQAFSDGTYYDEYRLGGTSLASPLFAGLTALRTQKAGTRLGALNPSIYANATSGAFTDVKGTPKDAGNVRADFANQQDASNGILYSVRAFNLDSSLAIAKGWDDVTGVGSPNPGWLTAPAG